MVVFDIETFNTDRAVRYAYCIYRLNKISGKYNRIIKEQEYQECLNDCTAFKGLDKINEKLVCVLQCKGEAKRVINKVVKYNLHFIAHKGSGFDSYVVLNNLPQWRTVVSLIRNGSSIVSLKIYNGYVDPVRKIPQYVQFRCGLLLNNDSLKKIGKSYIFQPCLLEQKLEQDKIIEDNWGKKKMNGCFIVKTKYYRRLSVMLNIVKVWKN